MLYIYVPARCSLSLFYQLLSHPSLLWIVSLFLYVYDYLFCLVVCVYVLCCLLLYVFVSGSLCVFCCVVLFIILCISYVVSVAVISVSSFGCSDMYPILKVCMVFWLLRVSFVCFIYVSICVVVVVGCLVLIASSHLCYMYVCARAFICVVACLLIVSGGNFGCVVCRVL